MKVDQDWNHTGLEKRYVYPVEQRTILLHILKYVSVGNALSEVCSSQHFCLTSTHLQRENTDKQMKTSFKRKQSVHWLLTLWGQAIVLGISSSLAFFGFILNEKNILKQHQEIWMVKTGGYNSVVYTTANTSNNPSEITIQLFMVIVSVANDWPKHL